MESLIISREKNTPMVSFNFATGQLDIKGSSIPEDTFKFYDPLVKWIEEYLRFLPRKVVINLQFDYLNTSSSKWILKILNLLSDYHEEHKCVSFNWYWDELDLYDTGHHYQTLLEIEMNYIEYR